MKTENATRVEAVSYSEQEVRGMRDAVFEGVCGMSAKRLSLFQTALLKDLEPNTWYDCYQNQGTGGKALPDWFYDIQTQPMMTLRPMLEARAIEGRKVEGFPQVRVCPI